MENGHRINVSRLDNGTYKHFFDIWAPQSRYGVDKVKEVVADLREKYDGLEWKIEVSIVTVVIRPLNR